MKVLKKISIITVVSLFLLINCSFADTGKVNTTSVRVREKATTDSPIVINVYKDDKVEVLDSEGEWYKVKVGNKEGYIKSEFIKLDKKTEAVNENNLNTESKTNNSSKIKLEIRSLPSLLSGVIGTTSEGKEITKISELSKWCKITDGEKTGWVLKSKLDSALVNENKTEVPENNKPEESKEVPKEQENKVETKTPEKTEETTSTNISAVINKIAVVNVKTLRVRKTASTSGEIIDLLDYNDEVTILAEEGTWYKVKYKNKEGYVDNSCVTLKTSKEVTSRGSLSENRLTAKETVAEEPQQEEAKVETPIVQAPVQENSVEQVISSASGQSVVDFAMQFVGYPYVSGGKKPETGFDCSGFTKYVFSNFGVSLGATAASQNSGGTEIARENLIPGDVLLFYDEGKTKIGHTGIYIGEGNFVHAANPKRGVVTDNLNTNTYYNTRFVTARRFVN